MCSWTMNLYRGNGRRPTLNDLLDCTEHVIKLVGAEHVAIGTDITEDFISKEDWVRDWGPQGKYKELARSLGSWYSYETSYAEGFESITQFPDVARGLIERGHSEATIHKILGDNFLRVFDRVWDR